MGSRKPQPRRSVLILARTITAFVSIALAEGMLWLLGYPSWTTTELTSADAASQYQPDPELGWINRVGVYDLAGPDRSSFRNTNWTEGRRATGPQQPPDDPRAGLMFFGDSYVYGYGLGDVDTFAWRIAQRHPEMRVANYGTPGYGTYQSYLAMKRSIAPAASAFYLLNAFHELRNVGDPSWIRSARRSSNGAFFPFAVLSGGAIQARRTDGDIIWPVSRHWRLAAMAEEYYEMASAWRRVRDQRAVTENLLALMDQAARSAGAAFTVVLFDGFDAPSRQAYRDFLVFHSIAFIDYNPPAFGDKTYRQADGHPNSKLDQMLADRIDSSPAMARVRAAR